jgi:hypothetical protein
MVGPQQISFGEVALLFICQEHSVFPSYRFNECSLFLELRLVFDFCLDLFHILLYLYIKVYYDLWSMFFSSKRVVSKKKFEWCWKREKALCKKVVQEGACVHCGLGFCILCLMSF